MDSRSKYIRKQKITSKWYSTKLALKNDEDFDNISYNTKHNTLSKKILRRTKIRNKEQFKSNWYYKKMYKKRLSKQTYIIKNIDNPNSILIKYFPSCISLIITEY